MPGTRESLVLGKTGLCRVPRHSAKIPLGKRWPTRDGGHLPSDFAECLTAGTQQFFFIFKNLFCRVPVPRHSANFFLKHILPSVSLGHSAIFFKFFKTYFAECQHQALGNFFLFLKINFAECPLGRHSTKPTLPSAPHGTRQNIFF